MRLLSFGSNGKFQLGHNHNHDSNHPQQVLFEDETVSLNGLLSLACGGNHTLLITDDNEAYLSGDNSRNQCGIPLKTDSYLPKFRLLPFLYELGSSEPIKWKLAAAGWEYSILVSTENKIYSTGFGPKGELGQGENVQFSDCFKKLEWSPPGNLSVIHVVASLSHVILLLNNGELWGWGVARKGQIGQPIASSIWEPRRVMIDGVPLSYIQDVDCGRMFTVVVDSNKKLQVLGDDRHVRRDDDDVPVNITSYQSMKCTWSSIHVLNKSGKVLSWGNNSHGQLAPEIVRQNTSDNDASVLSGTRLCDIATGTEHVLGLSLDRRIVYAWGWGEHGNCGRIDDSREIVNNSLNYANVVYKATSTQKIVGIFCGYASSWILIDDEL